MSDTPSTGAGGDTPPPADDFLTRRARERDESRRREEAHRQELETKLLGPLRELRPVWDEAWGALWRTLSPVWAPWQEPAAACGEPDLPAIARALHRIGAAIAQRDAITAWQNDYPLRPGVPAAWAARLKWVEEHEDAFTTEPPVVAAALVGYSVTATADQILDQVRLILAEPDDRPALGWMLTVRDCLWPLGHFPSPLDPVESIAWPGRWRVRMDDLRRLEYLLFPSAVPTDLDRLFRNSPLPAPPPAVVRRTLMPVDRIRVLNHVERVLASVPDPYPSGPPAEYAAALERWNEAHGGDGATLHSVASRWGDEFSQLAVNVHSTTGGWPATDPDNDLGRVVSELFQRAARVWEADWVFRQARNGGTVSPQQRVAAAEWHVEDGGWIHETLGQLLASTPDDFDQFKEAVRQFVRDIVSPEPDADRAEQPPPEARQSGTRSIGPPIILTPLNATKVSARIQARNRLLQRLRDARRLAPTPRTETATAYDVDTIPLVTEPPAVADTRETEKSVTAPDGKSDPKPDGLFDPCGFRWGQVEGEFLRDERRLYKLLTVAWPTFRLRTAMHADDANRGLEECGGSTLALKSLQNYARDLSDILTERFHFPARLELDGHYLRWRELPAAPP